MLTKLVMPIILVSEYKHQTHTLEYNYNLHRWFTRWIKIFTIFISASVTRPFYLTVGSSITC